MKAKTASRIHLEVPEAALWQPGPDAPPTLSPRERLHQNIARLQSLDRQLLDGPLTQTGLLTAIELVGFKIRHLVRQIQTTEQLDGNKANVPQSTASVC